ncbi:MAG: regulatory protein RecX [Phycisphaerales bacterium JB037]
MTDPPLPHPVLTALRSSANRPDRVRLMVGRETLATISRAACAELGLVPGTPITDDLRRRIESRATLEACRAKAIRLLRNRARTRKQLIDRLTRADFPRDTARTVADECADRGLIDDAAFAERFAESQLARAPTGPRLVEAKLAQKGIDRATATDAVRRAAAERDQLADATDLARRKLRIARPNLEPQVLKRRVFASLARRGFEADIARRALDAALADRERDRSASAE